MTSISRFLRLVTLLCLSLLWLSRPAHATPLPIEKVPEPLQPWVSWVLQDEKELGCPYLYNAKQQACRWPSRLQLELNGDGGRFTQQWQVFAETLVRLPGDQEHWPQQVQNDQGQALLVEEQSGLPHVRLTPGTHTVQGHFLWKKLPKSLRITPQSGLIKLRLNGKNIHTPNINSQGQLWLTQSQQDAASEDNLDIQVFRKIIDSHPIRVQTTLKLRVSGKQRNTQLTPVLLAGFIPLRLDSALPARLEGRQQQLQVQLRPGTWTLEITGRAPDNLTQFKLPASQPPWPQQEVWVLQNDNQMRQVEVTGVSSIDPNQTQLPESWRNLPAYVLNSGDTLTLKVLQRGAAQTGKQNLRLTRDMWLDFDGGGYTLKDQLNGDIQQQTRLNVLPALQLGRVSIGGEAQFITRQDDSAAGVEIRSRQLNLEAESRYTGAISTPPVNGWQQDLQRVDTQLYLPPGWRLFAATGTDNLPASWLQSWSLLDLFLVLVMAIATGYLFGYRWGGFALLALVFTWHEPHAPRLIWLNLLAVIALLRVMPEGLMKRWLNRYRWLSLLALAVIVLPYLLHTVRTGIYPQLDNSLNTRAFTSDYAQSGRVRQASPPQPAPMAMDSTELSQMQPEQEAAAVEGNMRRRQEVLEDIANQTLSTAKIKPVPPKAMQKSYNLQAIDPDSKVQTGPGLPSWNSYRSIHLHWSGPVKADETSRLLLLGPGLNLLLKLTGLLLLLGLSWRMLQMQRAHPPNTSLLSWLKRYKNTMPLLPLLLLPLLLLSLPQTARAASPPTALPEQALLDELHERLTRPPECLPQCAQIEHMQLEVSRNTLRLRLRVHAANATAIPLPGTPETWLAEDIVLDNEAVRAIRRDRRQHLWLVLPKGRHNISLRGILPQRNQITLPLPLAPHYVSWTITDNSWTLDGVRDNGTTRGQLQLNRVLDPKEQQRLEQRQTVLPTFVRVERELRLGLDWQVHTTVTRQAPRDTPISVQVPLLPNEQPMSETFSIKEQVVTLNLSAQQQQTSWTSRLTPGTSLNLKAAENPDYLESWKVAVSPVWHLETHGLPVTQYQQHDSMTIPVWQPWPGETLELTVSRPQGIEGQTVTILASTLAINPGKRANDVRLNLNIRSSRGVQHTLRLPESALLQGLTIDGVAQRIQRNGQPLKLNLRPGQQQVKLEWRETRPMGLHYRFPAVNLGLPSVNAQLNLSPSAERWILWTHGPLMGPAVLFWGVLLVLLVVSLILGYTRLTPLKSWQWFLLGIGLTQTEPWLMILVAGWLVALAWRGRQPLKLNGWQFNGLQAGLVLLTIVALGVLAVALSQGLLGRPEMQIAGNGSSAYNLNWYQDRSAETLPQPQVLSVPLWVYRVLMLAWALWLALAVLGWLRWGWQALNTGGLWMKRPVKPRKTKAPQTPETQQETN